MGDPLLIGIAGRARDREVASSLLRTILDGPEPYGRAVIVGAYELYDGAEWLRHPDMVRELGRVEEHARNAQKAGLPYLILELDEAAERGASRLDLLCAIGAGGAGTARTAARGLSFSARGPLADVGASEVEAHYGYVRFCAHTPAWSAHLAAQLTGLHSMGAALAAVSCAVLLDVDQGQLSAGLLNAHAPGHGELLFSPDQQVLALVEQSRSHRDAERAVHAARRDYAALRLEVVHGAEAVAGAVARACARAGRARTMLVLLDDSGDALADAFQAAVRAHARPPAYA